MNERFIEYRRVFNLPRIPLEGEIDLTYRCNNNCRHCWVRIPLDSLEAKRELTFDEIKRIVDEAKMMGCRKWYICGGEPMIRPDFVEIFDYITRNSLPYSINTNGTLITPEIARVMKRKGSKMISLYGATASVHDHITRTPGSFEETMRGFAYLREAGASFVVQIVPMRDNYHQLNDMITLAQSLSKYYRIAPSWLWLSAYGDSGVNQEIKQQRLSPKDVITLDRPDLCYEEQIEREKKYHCDYIKDNDRLFSSCIDARRDFYIDPYGQMTFCCFIKEPSLLYDLRKGNFKECWEKFIPSLVDKVRSTEEYFKNCGSCRLRDDCDWCPAWGYLEHRRFQARVDYLCEIAREKKRFKEDWKRNHRRYFRIADITIQVDSDLPITYEVLQPKFRHFEVDSPGEDMVRIRHYFSLPDLEGKDLGKEIYRRPPWVIYRKADSWIYLGVSSLEDCRRFHGLALLNNSHTRASIYNEETSLTDGFHSLTLFPTDQILLARILADRDGCYLHSCGINFEGKGFLFVGGSGAGKSTIAKMLRGKAEILCDDRVILRRWPEGFRIYGTWSHGEVSEISASSASLKAILFLKKSEKNYLFPLSERREIIKSLLSSLVRPLVTVDWWNKTLSLLEAVSKEVPCYLLYFDKSGKIINLLRGL